MVEETFLERLKNALAALVESRGQVSLFAALKMDEITDKWSIIVAAPWVRNATFEEVFNELRKLLIEHLGEDMSSVARIGIFTPEEHFTQLMLDAYKTDDVIREDRQINGNLVHSGAIIYANRHATLASPTDRADT